MTHDISNLTCADVFRAPGVQTPVIVRFSTVIHERGSPETLRDPRGFAVKFYTREGNWCGACHGYWSPICKCKRVRLLVKRESGVVQATYKSEVTLCYCPRQCCCRACIA